MKRLAPARSAARTSRSVATRVQLLDRGSRLVADRRRQVDHGVHAAEGVPERARIGQVPEGDLHPHALVLQALGISHEAAHRLALGGEASQ